MDSSKRRMSHLTVKTEWEYSGPMPHIRFRALKEDQVCHLSSELSPLLAAAIQTSEDNFTFEHVATQFFTQGKIVESYPFVEVLWFARAQEIQDQCAKIITDKVKSIANAEDVVVVFSVLDKSAYYENGKHF
ncbi:DUF1904 domain-containing protein [Bdellovibrio sp. HCB2-146]|uniref:DUF1904 domain-containing protein n=1 Tax=Bdellovibrio sp. HCB2-146 TaxID=3394362 RepID=UPI0039BCA8B8